MSHHKFDGYTEAVMQTLGFNPYAKGFYIDTLRLRLQHKVKIHGLLFDCDNQWPKDEEARAESILMWIDSQKVTRANGWFRTVAGWFNGP